MELAQIEERIRSRLPSFPTVVGAIAKGFNHAPKDARDALRYLCQNRVFSQQRLETYVAMVTFRNRIVHGYQTVADGVVYEIALMKRTDLLDFLREVMWYLDQCE